MDKDFASWNGKRQPSRESRRLFAFTVASGYDESHRQTTGSCLAANNEQPMRRSKTCSTQHRGAEPNLEGKLMRFRLLFLCSSIVLNSSVAIFADEADSAVAAPNEADSAQPTPEKQAATLPKQSVAELIARARKSVVVITLSGRDGKNDGMGTGFVVSSDGLIATNLHVIGEARPIEVRFADDKRYPVIAIHATQRSMDLAILRIDAKNLHPLQLADSDLLKQGQDVVAIGNPLGLEHSVVSGIVSGRREIDGKPMIQLAMPIEPGNSGGPLIDRQGRVHGILTLKSLVSASVGFAVAVNSLKPLLE